MYRGRKNDEVADQVRIGSCCCVAASGGGHQWQVASGVHNAGRYAALEHVHFKADGNTLTGTVAGSQDETPIKNGKIAGNTITFTADRPFGTFTYKGQVSGDEIRLSVQFNENNFDITAKRLK
jgi:hypothetical protein